MKHSSRSKWCLILVVALLANLVPTVEAGVGQGEGYGPGTLRMICQDLYEAQDIILQGNLWTLQSANRPLDRAKLRVTSSPFVDRHPRLANDLYRGIQKTKTQVLWNDADDAARAIRRTIRKAEGGLHHPEGSSNSGTSGISAGGLFGTAAAVGLGTVLWGAFRHWGWGSVWSSGSVGNGSGRNIWTNFRHNNPIPVN